MPPDDLSPSDRIRLADLRQSMIFAREFRALYERERQRRDELEAANRELERRLLDLMAVQDAVAAINSTRDPYAAFDLMAQGLAMVIGASHCLTLVWDSESGLFTRVLGLGIFQETEALAALRRSDLAARLLEAEEAWEIEDTAADGRADFGPLCQLGIRSARGEALRAQNRPRGVLIIGFGAPHVYDERERLLIGLIAQQAAGALQQIGLRDEVRRQTAVLEDLLRNLDDGVVLTDRAERVAFLNRAAAEIYGVTPAEVIGQPFARLCRRTYRRSANRAEFIAFARRARARPNEANTVHLHFADQPERVLRIRVFPLHDAEGRLAGYGQVLRLIDEEGSEA